MDVEEYNSYFERAKIFYNNLSSKSVTETYEYFLKYFHTDVAFRILAAFFSLPRKNQLFFLEIIKEYKFVGLTMPLLKLLIGERKLDLALEKRIIEVISSISNKIYAVELVELLENNSFSWQEFLKLSHTINKIDYSYFKKWIQLLFLYSHQEREKDRETLKEILISILQKNDFSQLFIDELLKENFFKINYNLKNKLLEKIVLEIGEWDLRLQNEFVKELAQEDRIYGFILRNKVKYKFSPEISRLFKNFTPELRGSFIKILLSLLKEKTKYQEWNDEILSWLLDFDHRVEHYFIKKLNFEMNKEKRYRNYRQIIYLIKILITKSRVSDRSFEDNLAEYIPFFYQSKKRYFAEFISYMERNLIPPNKKLLEIFFREEDRELFAIFTRYFLTLFLQKKLSFQEKELLVKFLKTKSKCLEEARRYDLYFLWLLETEDYERAVGYFKKIFPIIPLDKKEFLIEKIYYHCSQEFKEKIRIFLQAICEKSALTPKAQLYALKILFEILKDDFWNYLFSLNGNLNILFWKDFIKNGDLNENLIHLFDALETNLVVKNYLLNSLKTIRGVTFTKENLALLIKMLDTKMDYRRELLLLLYNNQVEGISEYRQELEKMFFKDFEGGYHRESDDSSKISEEEKIVFSWVLRKNFSYKEWLEELKKNISAKKDLDEDDWRKLEIYSYLMPLFEEKFLWNFNNDNLKLKLLNNMLFFLERMKVNSLLTKFRLEESPFFKSYFWGILKLSLREEYLKPFIHFYNPTNKEQEEEYLSFLRLYPISILKQSLLQLETEMEKRADEKILQKISWLKEKFGFEN